MTLTVRRWLLLYFFHKMLKKLFVFSRVNSLGIYYSQNWFCKSGGDSSSLNWLCVPVKQEVKLIIDTYPSIYIAVIPKAHCL